MSGFQGLDPKDVQAATSVFWQTNGAVTTAVAMVARVARADWAMAGSRADGYRESLGPVVRRLERTAGDIGVLIRELLDNLGQQIDASRAGPTGPAGHGAPVILVQSRQPAPPTDAERGPWGRGGAYVDGDRVQLRPRNRAVLSVTLPSNIMNASGFVVRPVYDPRGGDHTYFVPASTFIPFNEVTRGLFGDAFANNPVPTWGESPASETGTRNDAMWGDYVRSFRIQSPDPTRYSDIVVNYTIAGEHRLHEGYVIRYAERDERGNVRLITYGEGNSPWQHRFNPLAALGAEVVWGGNNGEIVRQVQSDLAARPR